MWEDIRSAFRLTRRFPFIVAAAIASIAIGVAAATVVFSVAEGLLFWVPRIHEPERVFALRGGHVGPAVVSYLDYQDYARAATPVASMGASMIDGASVTLGERTEVVVSSIVSDNYFDVLGVRPALGAGFTPGDANVATWAVVSDRLWRRLGGTPQSLGSAVIVYGAQFTIVGIMPPSFQGLSPDIKADVWISVDGAKRTTFGDVFSRRNVRAFTAFARLHDGQTRAALLDSLHGIDQDLDKQFGPPRTVTGPLVAENMRGVLNPTRRRMLDQNVLLLAVAVGVILLIVCSNVASMMVSVMKERAREIAIRLAVGGSRARLVRQFLIEGGLLWGLAGALGLALALGGMALALRSFPPRLFGTPLGLGLEVNRTTLALSVGSCVVVGMLLSVLPVWYAMRRSVLQTMRTSSDGAAVGRGRTWFRDGLLVVQVALSMVLLVSNTQVIRSLVNASNVDLGYQPDGRVSYLLHPDPKGYPDASIPPFYERLTSRVAALPGVKAVGMIDFLPLSGFVSRWCYADATTAPSAETDSLAPIVVVSPGYFAAMGIPVLAGRDFNTGDRRGTPGGVIVSEALARTLWPNADPLAQRLRMGARAGADCATPLQVIGVVKNNSHSELHNNAEPLFYVAFDQQPDTYTWRTLVVDVAQEPQSALETIRREIMAVGPTASVQRGQTVREQVDVQLWPVKVSAAMLSVLGIVGVLVVASALYAMITAYVLARTREIAIRIALGAPRYAVVRLVVARCVLTTAAGIVVGLWLSTRASTAIGGLLQGVEPGNPNVYLIAGILLPVVATLAAWLPARRAVTLDPAAALRTL